MLYNLYFIFAERNLNGMTTLQIIKAISKGNTVSRISEKQKSWLINQAVNENVKVIFDGSGHNIYLDDCFYKITNSMRLASGGSYVAKKAVPGYFKMEKMYKIQFADTGLTFVYSQTELDHLKKSNHQFKIINPLSK